MPIVFMTDAPRSRHPNALASALPYSNSGQGVYVFYDRLRERARVNPMLAGPLLGHVLVHEATHRLQGIARHSDSGVMRAFWSAAEYDSMLKTPLPFAAVDAELVTRGFDSTAARGCEAVTIARR